MCTIIVINRVFSAWPVIIAANRDEFYARPTRGPEPLASGGLACGIDEKAGGTWMGVTRSGFFVGLTNQRQGRAAPGVRSSRGAVVTNALARGQTAAVEEMLASAPPMATNPFNLLFGTAERLRCAYVRDDGTRFEDVPLGVSVLPNDVLGSPRFPKAARALELASASADAHAASWQELADQLRAILGNHDHAPRKHFETNGDAMHGMPLELQVALDSLCVHAPLYGTRSYSLIALRDGGVGQVLHGDGPPCTSPPRDITLLATADVSATI